MTDQAFRLPDERPSDGYGDRSDDRPARPGGRWLIMVGLGSLVLLALAWWIWIAVVQVTPAVRFEVLGFQPLSTTSVEIRFSVVREPGVSVACVLRARGASGAEVGRRQVLVPAEPTEQRELNSIVRTTGAAVTGEVLACEPYAPPTGLRMVDEPEALGVSVADLLP